MSFWIREICGWLLVLLGLATFLYCRERLFEGYIIEGAELMIIGIIIFRGGIHLLKVSLAARICLRAQDAAPAAKPAPAGARRPERLPARTVTRRG